MIFQIPDILLCCHLQPLSDLPLQESLNIYFSQPKVSDSGQASHCLYLNFRLHSVPGSSQNHIDWSDMDNCLFHTVRSLRHNIQ